MLNPEIDTEIRHPSAGVKRNERVVRSHVRWSPRRIEERVALSKRAKWISGMASTAQGETSASSSREEVEIATGDRACARESNLFWEPREYPPIPYVSPTSLLFFNLGVRTCIPRNDRVCIPRFFSLVVEFPPGVTRRSFLDQFRRVNSRNHAIEIGINSWTSGFYFDNSKGIIAQ